MHQVGLDSAVLFVALCSAERQREVTEADAPALASGARPSGVFISPLSLGFLRRPSLKKTGGDGGSVPVNRVSVNECAQCGANMTAPECRSISPSIAPETCGPARAADIGMKTRSTCQRESWRAPTSPFPSSSGNFAMIAGNLRRLITREQVGRRSEQRPGGRVISRRAIIQSHRITLGS